MECKPVDTVAIIGLKKPGNLAAAEVKQFGRARDV
jgi:hypothetical protein